MSSEQSIESQLQDAIAECQRLREENTLLRQQFGLTSIESGSVNTVVSDLAPVASYSAAGEKLKLFRSLFRGREDVYAVRWEGRNGKSGYMPAYRREWGSGASLQNEKTKEYFPLTDDAVRNHLTGKTTIGVYPLLRDNSCWFLAVDFDKKDWSLDATEFLATCKEWDVPAVFERSRSGNGGHVWIFFKSAVQAALARNLGASILTRTMDRRHLIGLDSYDRFFPNQETMPKGGFGNLIALPLQHRPRQNGNSVFVDENLKPFHDQWAVLSTIQRMDENHAEEIVKKAQKTGQVVGLRLSVEDDGSDPWTLPPSKKPKCELSIGPLPSTVRITLANFVYVEKQGLPSGFLNRLHRLAAFQNPEFYRAQAMRFSTFGKPRIIHCAEELSNHVAVPRGCFDDVMSLFEVHGISPMIENQATIGHAHDLKFFGELRPDQRRAAKALIQHDHGVLCATTAFGKTVIAAWLIARRKVNTLILVHRRQLLDQWIERLTSFLHLPKIQLGKIGGGSRRLTGVIDVAVIQSLYQKHTVDDLVTDYGHVIVDECHHVSAVSFEQVLRQVKARYVTGLTATPVRKDGHHPIITMQCGPIRYRVDAKTQAKLRPFNHIAVPRATDLRLQAGGDRFEIHQIYAALAKNRRRNDLIASDVISAVRSGRSPIVLTERVSHICELEARLAGDVKNVIVLRGGAGMKKRKAEKDQLDCVSESEDRVLLATGRYIGEGFDDSRLDTLFLAMPIAWKGTLQQYAGRLHRLHDNKQVVVIYDYVDAMVPVLDKMFLKRRKGYEAIGYEVRDDWDWPVIGR